mmetsp:Transcript_8865/g.22963  ORF Transcript_8865/g.22963 Transcript_8865/m.22963 type:complete len:230 (-) Transcript_8865:622-1311(-)
MVLLDQILVPAELPCMANLVLGFITQFIFLQVEVHKVPVVEQHADDQVQALVGDRVAREVKSLKLGERTCAVERLVGLLIRVVARVHHDFERARVESAGDVAARIGSSRHIVHQRGHAELLLGGGAPHGAEHPVLGPEEVAPGLPQLLIAVLLLVVIIGAVIDTGVGVDSVHYARATRHIALHQRGEQRFVFAEHVVGDGGDVCGGVADGRCLVHRCRLQRGRVARRLA